MTARSMEQRMAAGVCAGWLEKKGDKGPEFLRTCATRVQMRQPKLTSARREAPLVRADARRTGALPWQPAVFVGS